MINKKLIPLFFLPLLLVPIFYAEAGNLTVTVTDHLGNGVEGLQVELIDENNIFPVEHSDRLTNPSGTIAISAPNGNYTLSIADSNATATNIPKHFHVFEDGICRRYLLT